VLGAEIEGRRAGRGKDALLERGAQAAEARLHEPFLFVGDFNTGAHRLDETGKTFVCAEHFGKLSACGWTDVWRHHNNDTEWTWYSKLKGGARGNGFRLDYCFATPSLLPRVTSCRYSHADREAGISDHSIAIIEVKNRQAKALRLPCRA
jgi:exonuclease III